MARPAARRLLDLIKRRRRKALMGKFIPFYPLQQKLQEKGAAGKKGGANKDAQEETHSLTCLIHSKDINLQGNLSHYSHF